MVGDGILLQFGLQFLGYLHRLPLVVLLGRI